jgi:hypothetical protein
MAETCPQQSASNFIVCLQHGSTFLKDGCTGGSQHSGNNIQYTILERGGSLA